MNVSCLRSGSLKAEPEMRILRQVTWGGCSQVNILRQGGSRTGQGGSPGWVAAVCPVAGDNFSTPRRSSFVWRLPLPQRAWSVGKASPEL